MNIKTKTKLINRIEAWKTIRRAYRPGKWTPWQPWSSDTGKLNNYGLCNAVSLLHDAKKISGAVALLMRRDILSVRPAGAVAYYWRQNRDGAAQRVAAISTILKALKK